jgi:hypothetical protein
VEAAMSDAAPKKKRKRNPTLVALLVLLPLLVWGGFEFRSMLKYGPTPQPGQSPRLAQLVQMSPDDVARVELKTGAKSLVLARADKEWRLEQPIAAKADAGMVDQMLKDLLEPNVDSVIADRVEDPSQYGLDKPVFQATLTGRGGQKRVIQTGLKDPRDIAVYAREASQPALFLLSSFTVDNLKAKKAEDLRDKTVLAIEPEKVKRLTIEKPGSTVVVERKGSSDDWVIAQPTSAPAEKEDLRFYLTQLKELKVEKFVAEQAEDLAKYGLTQPQLSVTVDGTPEKKFLIGKAVTGDASSVYAARAGEKQVFSVRNSVLTDLGKSAGDLRDKTLLSFKRDDATKLALSSPAGQVELERQGQEWKVTKPFSAKAKTEKLDPLFFGIEAVKGTSVAAEAPADLTPYGLEKPQAKVSVWLKGENNPKELMIGKKSATGDGYYARSAAGPTVFVIPEYILSDVKIKPADLKG